MITEKYCNEILQQYPEYITKDQMYRICHISKKTCLFLLESGLVPNIDSGKKTRRFKIKTVDVIQYLKDRDDYADLNPVVGSEQGGTRPVLVISNDIGNKHSPTVIIAAITSRVRKKKKLPTHLYLGQIEGLPANSIILFEQLRTIDKSRLKEHLTHLDEKYLKSLEFPLLISIGVEKRRSL